MSVAIRGCGWVTPMGAGVDAVCQAILRGERAEPVTQTYPDSGRVLRSLRVPDADIAHVSRLPRLRRSSRISHLGMAAAMAAIADSGLDPADPNRRWSVLFAASDGGVIYTRKFFAELSERGTQAGSPLLFPETVYNAPASHIAAQLGITGTTSTVVGDATVSIHALAMAEDLLNSGDCDSCLLVAAEEMDWIIAEAYSVWGIGDSDRLLFADGAAAVVLEREGACRVTCDAGSSYSNLVEAKSAVVRSLEAITEISEVHSVVGSASGGKFDTPETSAIAEVFGSIAQIYPKFSLGEAFGTSTLSQVIVATRMLQSPSTSSIAVPVLGWNGQCAAASVRLHERVS